MKRTIIDVLEENEMLRHSLGVAITKLTEYNNDYKKPSKTIEELKLTKQLYKEIIK